MCNPCFIDNRQLSATHFCKTCVDPEPLCETCAKEHIRQQMSRYHEICENIRNFPVFKPQIKYIFTFINFHKKVKISFLKITSNS